MCRCALPRHAKWLSTNCAAKKQRVRIPKTCRQLLLLRLLHHLHLRQVLLLLRTRLLLLLLQQQSHRPPKLHQPQWQPQQQNLPENVIFSEISCRSPAPRTVVVVGVVRMALEKFRNMRRKPRRQRRRRPCPSSTSSRKGSRMRSSGQCTWRTSCSVHCHGLKRIERNHLHRKYLSYSAKRIMNQRPACKFAQYRVGALLIRADLRGAMEISIVLNPEFRIGPFEPKVFSSKSRISYCCFNRSERISIIVHG